MINFSCQDKTPEFCSESREIISNAKIVIVGVGALGTVSSELIVRSGALNLTIIDDDIVSEKNLPRQMLFFENDIDKLKVDIATKFLKKINSKTKITAFSSRLNKDNCNKLLSKADIVLDCTDNLSSRLIIDNWCKKNNVMWIHAAAQRVTGEIMLITPESSTYSDYMINKKENKGCAEEGILGVTSLNVASMQVAFALKALTGNTKMNGFLYRINVWDCSIERYVIKKNTQR